MRPISNYRVWLSVLFVADAAFFGYCVRRFHAEFAGVACSRRCRDGIGNRPGNLLRYYAAVVLLINGVLLLAGLGTAINADWTRLQAIGSLVSLSATLCAAFLVVGAIAIGTIASQLWARYAGLLLSVLAIGFVALVGLLTYPRVSPRPRPVSFHSLCCSYTMGLSQYSFCTSRHSIFGLAEDAMAKLGWKLGREAPWHC